MSAVRDMFSRPTPGLGEVKRIRGEKQPLTAAVRPTARMKIVVGSVIGIEL